jgi:hypothetical protein
MANAMLDARQEGDSYRRIEVITGQRRRRRWTAQEKARIVNWRWLGSGRTDPLGWGGWNWLGVRLRTELVGRH